MPAKTYSETSAAAATDGAGRHPRDRVGSYGLLIAAYVAATGSFLGWRQASGKGLPERFDAADLALIGVATHKSSRLIAKDKVATPIRAPFTEFEEEGAPADFSEKPAGGGLRRTIGELVACPYCLDMWVATGYAAGLVAAPRATRFLAAVLTTVAIADFLQVAYKVSQDQA